MKELLSGGLNMQFSGDLSSVLNNYIWKATPLECEIRSGNGCIKRTCDFTSTKNKESS